MGIRSVKCRISSYQFGILSSRYLDIFAADWGNLLLLLMQAPVIALCIVLVWRDLETATDSLYFVMCLSAVWFGAINSAREIVKESALLRREASIGLELGSYIAAKFTVLAVLGVIQCLLLTVMVNWQIPLKGWLPGHFFTLFFAEAAGTGLGLVISSLASTSDRAVALVPIFLLPQILFSKVVLANDHPSFLTRCCRNLTITEWAYDAQKQVVAAVWEYQPFVLDLAALSFMVLILLTLTVFTMRERLVR